MRVSAYLKCSLQYIRTTNVVVDNIICFIMFISTFLIKKKKTISTIPKYNFKTRYVDHTFEINFYLSAQSLVRFVSNVGASKL